MIIIDKIDPSDILARHKLPPELGPNLTLIVEAILNDEDPKSINERIFAIADSYPDFDLAEFTRTIVEYIESRPDVNCAISTHLAMDNL